MQIEWAGPILGAKDGFSLRDIQEALEDPFGLRFMPDTNKILKQSRAVSLGRTLEGQGIFSVFRSDGKFVWVVAARPMSEEEEYFYNRKATEWM